MRALLWFLPSALALFLCLYFYTTKTNPQAPLPEPLCDPFENPCTSHLPSGEKVSFSLKIKSFPVLSPISIALSVEKLSLLQASVEFQNLYRPMGENHPSLVFQDNGTFKGKTLLPSDSTAPLYWDAIVHLKTSAGSFSVHFPFKIDPPDLKQT